MEVFGITEGVLIPRMSSERWQELKVYPLKPDDLFISCYPRSGSTWTQHIVRLLRNGGRDDGKNLDDAVPWLEVLGTDKGNMMKLNPNAAEELESPRSLKVHLPYNMTPGGEPHTTRIKYIYVARNPKDVCVSFWYFSQSQIQKFSPGNDSSIPWETFFSDFFDVKSFGSIYGGWMNHVLGWWKHRSEPNILFIKYEDMKREPKKTVQTMAEFMMGVENVTQELVEEVVHKSSFSSMWDDPTINKRKKEGASVGVTFLRKGIIGDWKNHFTAEQNAKFEEKVGKVLKENGLEFDYE